MTPTQEIPTVDPSLLHIREEFSDNSGLNPEDVARVAYELWEKRDCRSGSPEGDWLEAEHRLRAIPYQ